MSYVMNYPQKNHAADVVMFRGKQYVNFTCSALKQYYLFFDIL